MNTAATFNEGTYGILPRATHQCSDKITSEYTYNTSAVLYNQTAESLTLNAHETVTRSEETGPQGPVWTHVSHTCLISLHANLCGVINDALDSYKHAHSCGTE